MAPFFPCGIRLERNVRCLVCRRQVRNCCLLRDWVGFRSFQRDVSIVALEALRWDGPAIGEDRQTPIHTLRYQAEAVEGMVGCALATTTCRCRLSSECQSISQFGRTHACFRGKRSSDKYPNGRVMHRLVRQACWHNRHVMGRIIDTSLCGHGSTPGRVLAYNSESAGTVRQNQSFGACGTTGKTVKVSIVRWQQRLETHY
jgi:hypothetical protein